MRIALGCDHVGFPLKQAVGQALEAEGHSVLDLGTFSAEPVDYPDFARSVAQAVIKGFVEQGILVCDSGSGVAMAANKIRGIRAAFCPDPETAWRSRQEENGNVLCLGARALAEPAALEIARAWLNTPFGGEERHLRRLAKLEQIESTGLAERPAAGLAAAAPVPATAPPRPAAPAPAPPAPATARPAPAPPAAAPPPRPVPPAPVPTARPAGPARESGGGPASVSPGTVNPAAAAQAPAPAGAAAPPPAPPPPPPVIERPRPKPMQSSLAAEAEALLRQFKKEGEDEEEVPPARREGVISLDDALEELVETRPRPRGPEPRPRPEPARPAPPPRPAEPRPAPARAEPPRPPAPPPAPPPPPPPPDALRAPEVDQVVAALEEDDLLGRLWTRDVGLWPGDANEIRNRLGWLTAPTLMREQADELRAFADEIRRLSFTHVVLLGMGGSSLAGEMFSASFGSKMGFLDLLVLDSTDPGAIRRTLDRVPLARTIFLVATKSGTTAETLALYHFFRHQVEQGRPSKPGLQFVAITDGGTPLEQLAQDAAFRRTFLNPPTVGGRYSALTFFGLVPAALIGVDVRGLLERAGALMERCGPDVPAPDNPGIRLGAALAAFARAGRDKLTLVLSERLAGFGGWVEQLIAESLGKAGRGVVPVDGEPLGPPAVYGEDRLFVAILMDGDHSQDAAIAELARAGHPVVRLVLHEPLDLGAECFRWELAVAVAGAALGVNPFDEPDVAAAKQRTSELLTAWKKTRRLPEWAAACEEDGVVLATGGERPASVGEGLARHLEQLGAGDYLAVQAYLTPLPDTTRALRELRVAVRDRHKVATTVAYGPRYLHSTGQLHKGGPATGLFLQVTADDAEDLAIPGQPHGFATLKAAQALGDLEALRAAGRRVLRVHLKGKLPQALDRLVQAVQAACRKR
jgi:RpiB/LacA/LacB family sugar-phosphate isomerase